MLLIGYRNLRALIISDISEAGNPWERSLAHASMMLGPYFFLSPAIYRPNSYRLRHSNKLLTATTKDVVSVAFLPLPGS